MKSFPVFAIVIVGLLSACTYRQETAGRPAIVSDSRSYCQALSDKWRAYRLSQSSSPEAAAMAECAAGNYRGGIPVLEEALLTAQIPLPAPGYRWPG